MGILNAQDRDLVQTLENKKFQQLASYTMKLIRNNSDQWGLYILEAITFIIKRIVRKGHEHINQYQIELNKLQYLPENDNSNNQLWIIQTYQLLRLLRVNNKFFKSQTTHSQSQVNTEQDNQPAPGPQTISTKKVLASINVISQPYYPEKHPLIKPPNKIEKKIIYQDDDDSNWSDKNPVYYSDESQNEDSIEQTLLGSERHVEKPYPPTYLGDRQNYKDLLNLSDDVIDDFMKNSSDAFNYNDALQLNQYQIVENQLIDQDPTINKYNIKQQIAPMQQQINKAQLQDRLDKREACMSIWTQSINTTYFYTIKEFVNSLKIFSLLDKDIYDKTDDLLKAAVKTATGISPSKETLKMLKFFALIIMKNSEANEKSCIYIHGEADEHTNRVKLYLKCLQKHAYFIKSDIIQLLTTRLKEQIALKEISFSIRIQPLDNKLRFKESDGYIQILNGKKSRRKNNRLKSRQPNKKRRNNKRGKR